MPGKPDAVSEKDPVNPLRTRLSVVIPVLQEPDALPLLLNDLRNSPDPPDEILVVDGDKHGRHRALCRQMSCAYLSAAPCRGSQLHTGAAEARGEILWFLHADSRPDPAAAAHIRHAIDHGASGGYLRFRFTGRVAWYKSLLEKLINWRARLGVPYGDQGLFFSRLAYEATGGFTDLPLFEEVPLVRAVRQHGPFVAIDCDIGVSPRRWERDGWIRRTLQNRLLAVGYMIGVSPHALARRYRPVNASEETPC
jgi:rSAM/selenodomain-associated transferase 2